ncbi:hypothetical protein KKG65_00930 [Patescibacteria group bacterium]|nr:hypothetical protein [Patescibacteria group bacterium]
MKKTTLLIVILVLASTMLTGCFNKAADAPASINPFTWFDVTLERTLAENCANGKNQVIIEGEIYTCPNMVSAPNNSIPDAPPPVTPPSTPPVTPKIVGAYFDACTSVDLDDDITYLKNNGEVVPNSFMFLDKNETEIAAGDYWFIDVPGDVYGQVFFPITGLTYQVRGPAKLMVGAATFWCDNGGKTPQSSQYQMIDAKKIDILYLNSYWELEGDGVIGSWVNVPPVENQPK